MNNLNITPSFPLNVNMAWDSQTTLPYTQHRYKCKREEEDTLLLWSGMIVGFSVSLDEKCQITSPFGEIDPATIIDNKLRFWNLSSEFSPPISGIGDNKFATIVFKIPTLTTNIIVTERILIFKGKDFFVIYVDGDLAHEQKVYISEMFLRASGKFLFFETTHGLLIYDSKNRGTKKITFSPHEDVMGLYATENFVVVDYGYRKCVIDLKTGVKKFIIFPSIESGFNNQIADRKYYELPQQNRLIVFSRESGRLICRDLENSTICYTIFLSSDYDYGHVCISAIGNNHIIVSDESKYTLYDGNGTIVRRHDTGLGSNCKEYIKFYTIRSPFTDSVEIIQLSSIEQTVEPVTSTN